MEQKTTCLGCGKSAPEADSEFTLVSPQIGWRVARRALPDGTFVIEWRCPQCWRDYRDKRGGAR